MSAYLGPLVAQPLENLSLAERPRAIQPLPTDRVSPQNQLEILRAWASVSREGTRAATVNEIASTVDMAASTVAMTNPFFSSIRLLQRLARGTYIPSKEVIAFFNAKKSRTAGRELAPVFRDAWFGQLLIPKLKYAPMSEQTALSQLEDASGVAQEQTKALGFILDFMEEAELIKRNGDQIKLTRWCAAPPPPLIPMVSLDGSTYCVTVRVDSKALAERLVDLFTSLAALAAKK